jgi:hypothetical protein
MSVSELFTANGYDLHAKSLNVKDFDVASIDALSFVSDVIYLRDDVYGEEGSVLINNDGIMGGSTILKVTSDTIEISSTDPGALTVTGGSDIYGIAKFHNYIKSDAGGIQLNQGDENLSVTLAPDSMGGLDIDAVGTVNIVSTEPAVSSSTGALVVAGGMGVMKKLYVKDFLQVDGITTVSNVSVGGGAIGNVSYFKFWSNITGVAWMQVSPHTNSSGTTTDTIFTGTGVVPSALRPAVYQRVPCLLLANGVYVNGWCVIQTDGRIVFTHPTTFTELETNGWSGVIVQYSLL